jgi:uncharacterized membrane protein
MVRPRTASCCESAIPLTEDKSKNKTNQMTSACAAIPMLISVFQNQDFFVSKECLFMSPGYVFSDEEIDAS